MTPDELTVIKQLVDRQPRVQIMSMLPSIISGLTVICAVIGMLWSFMLNQNTFQAVNSQKLDVLSTTLTEIRKNADQVPLIGLQLQQMDARQKLTEEQEKKNEQKLGEVSEALIRMGVRNLK